MIFQVNAKEFIRAIKPAVEVATTNAMKEFKYENLITLKADKNKLAIFAYSGIASLIAPVSNDNFPELDYECEDTGKATVHALDLLNAVTTIPPEKIEISVDTFFSWNLNRLDTYPPLRDVGRVWYCNCGALSSFLK